MFVVLVVDGLVVVELAGRLVDPSSPGPGPVVVGTVDGIAPVEPEGSTTPALQADTRTSVESRVQVVLPRCLAGSMSGLSAYERSGVEPTVAAGTYGTRMIRAQGHGVLKP